VGFFNVYLQHLSLQQPAQAQALPLQHLFLLHEHFSQTQALLQHFPLPQVHADFTPRTGVVHPQPLKQVQTFPSAGQPQNQHQAFLSSAVAFKAG
jgi:hypothetical protein